MHPQMPYLLGGGGYSRERLNCRTPRIQSLGDGKSSLGSWSCRGKLRGDSAHQAKKWFGETWMHLRGNWTAGDAGYTGADTLETYGVNVVVV
jgi:hypothetical protein